MPIINNQETDVQFFIIKSLIIYNQGNEVILNYHDVVLIIYNSVFIIHNASHIINNHVIQIVLFINTLEL